MGTLQGAHVIMCPNHSLEQHDRLPRRRKRVHDAKVGHVCPDEQALACRALGRRLRLVRVPLLLRPRTRVSRNRVYGGQEWAQERVEEGVGVCVGDGLVAFGVNDQHGYFDALPCVFRVRVRSQVRKVGEELTVMMANVSNLW